MKDTTLTILTAPGVSGDPEITHEGIALRNTLLAASHEITSVNDTLERDEAIEVSGQIQTHLKAIEFDLKDVTKPHKDLVKQINALAFRHTDELSEERCRLDNLIGRFEDEQMEERAKERGMQVQKYLEAEAERKQALEDVHGEDIVKALQAETKLQETQQSVFDAEQALMSADEDKAKGGSLRRDWSVEVLDVKALYEYCPKAVKLVPLMTEIKMLLEIHGNVIPGVSGVKKTTFATRKQK